MLNYFILLGSILHSNIKYKRGYRASLKGWKGSKEGTACGKQAKEERRGSREGFIMSGRSGGKGSGEGW